MTFQGRKCQKWNNYYKWAFFCPDHLKWHTWGPNSIWGQVEHSRALQGPIKASNMSPQRLEMAKYDHKGKKLKKLNRINNQGPLFGWFHTQVKYFGVKVHMGTMDPVWGTVGGLKWSKLSPNRLTVKYGKLFHEMDEQTSGQKDRRTHTRTLS